MSLYIFDCEADGPCSGLFSMLEVGFVKMTPSLDVTFWDTLRPITDNFKVDALNSINTTREKTLLYNDPEEVVKRLVEWVDSTTIGRPVLASDNNGFDWQFLNYYCHYYVGRNPFGFSSRRIGDFYSGLEKDFYAASKWKKFRKTKHTHNALDDALGNAEALLTISKIHGIKIPLM